LERVEVEGRVGIELILRGNNMMLKCGQKDNKKYTFGVRKDQMEDEVKEVVTHKTCSACKTIITSKSNYCPSCGGKL